MKKEIHPQYFNKSTISCACGANYQTGSTIENIQVELCSKCHPFYTGKQKIIDTARRVEKFQTRLAQKSTDVVKKKTKHAKRDEQKKEKQAKKQEA